jgi:hypothetical protein
MAHPAPTQTPTESSTQRPSLSVLQSGPVADRGELWLNLVCGVLCLVYFAYFIGSIGHYWFSPEWTTDDALQQTYPFHEVYEPGRFEGDLITTMMKGYLTPLHYWITYGFTYLTQDAILAGHWVQLVQLLVTCGFLAGALYLGGGFIPACFGFVWFLHTRHVIQRLTVGLVRGWAAPVLAGYLYFALSRNHLGMRLCLIVGCLLHPPATFLIAVAYGGLLLWELIDKKTRDEAKRPFVLLLLISPICAVLALYSTSMPPEIGTMATYQETLNRPEFARPGGRFPFTPLVPLLEEIKTFAFQTFTSKWYKISRTGDNLLQGAVALLTVFLFSYGAIKRRWYVPKGVSAYFFATVFTYLLSRQVAFHLYVPNRHLQIPLSFFFIAAFTLGFWKLGNEVFARTLKRQRGGALLLLVVALLVVGGSGHGLYSRANFNWHTRQRGEVFEWIRENTPEESLIAGHPTFVDAVQLFAHRKVYASTETAHPFYDKYYEQIEPRLALSLRAHYAKDLLSLYQLVAPEGIDYFVLERKRFYPEELKEASYFRPLDQVVSSATQRPWKEYAYRQLPRELDSERAPYLVYRDAYSVVIDIAALGKFLEKQSLAPHTPSSSSSKPQ